MDLSWLHGQRIYRPNARAELALGSTMIKEKKKNRKKNHFQVLFAVFMFEAKKMCKDIYLKVIKLLLGIYKR